MQQAFDKDFKWSSKEFIVQNRKRQKKKQAIAYTLMYTAAGIAVLILLLIIGYTLVKGIDEISWEFLTGDIEDAGREGGIFPVIINTLYLVGMGLLFAAPLSILAAIYLTEYAKQGIFIKIIRFFTTNLAGIPSIIFGLFGMMFFSGILKWGYSILSGAATIAIVVLPTLIRATEEAIMTVPKGYKEGSLALGATKWQTMYKVVIPTSSPGIVNGVILSMGRIIGETAALMFTLGMGYEIAESLMDSGRSLSLHLFMLANEGIAPQKAYATATVLVVVVIILNLIAGFFGKRLNRYKDVR